MPTGKGYGLTRFRLVDLDERPLGIVGNPLIVAGLTEEPPAANSIITDVPASPVPVVILAANSTRLSFSIFNDSNKVLTIALDGAVSPTHRTTKVPPQWEYVPPQDIDYVGVVTGYWSAGASGGAGVTELVP